MASNPMFGKGGDEIGDSDMSLGGGSSRSSEDFMFTEKSDQSKWKQFTAWQRNEMDAFMMKYFLRSDDEMEKERVLDKLTFLLSVVMIVAVGVCMANPYARRILPYLFSITTIVMIVIRYFQYKKRKSHYFLVDFCYWMNLMSIIQVTAAPQNEVFFALMFAITHSILPWTIIAYRNSMVFHSIDKFTSFAVHAFPMALYYTVRWHPKDCAAWWWDDFSVEVTDLFGNEIGGNWIILAVFQTGGTITVFVVQQLLEMLFLYQVAKKFTNFFHVYTDPSYQTLFRFSANKGKGFIYNFLNALGPKWQLLMWFLLNLVFASLTSVPVHAWYANVYANALFAVLVFLAGTWNAGNFYIEVFSRKYKAVRKPKSAQTV